LAKLIYNKLYVQTEKNPDLLTENAGIKTGGRSKKLQILKEK